MGWGGGSDWGEGATSLLPSSPGSRTCSGGGTSAGGGGSISGSMVSTGNFALATASACPGMTTGDHDRRREQGKARDGAEGSKRAHPPAYWLAQMMRAIHSISAMGISRFG